MGEAMRTGVCISSACGALALQLRLERLNLLLVPAAYLLHLLPSSLSISCGGRSSGRSTPCGITAALPTHSKVLELLLQCPLFAFSSFLHLHTVLLAIVSPIQVCVRCVIFRTSSATVGATSEVRPRSFQDSPLEYYRTGSKHWIFVLQLLGSLGEISWSVGTLPVISVDFYLQPVRSTFFLFLCGWQYLCNSSCLPCHFFSQGLGLSLLFVQGRCCLPH